jgi:hypothetical protein
LQRASLQHGVETHIDPRLQLFSICSEEDRKDVLRIKKRRRPLGLKRAKASSLHNPIAFKTH